MYKPIEKVAELAKTNVAQASKFATCAMDSVEKLNNLNMATMKAGVVQGMDNAQALFAVRDMKALQELGTKAAEFGVQNTMGYWRSYYKLSTEAQDQYKELAQDAWGLYTKDIKGWFVKLTKSGPDGSNVAVDAFKNTVAATTAAFDQFKNATKQVVSLADASVRAAAAPVVEAVQAPKGKKAA